MVRKGARVTTRILITRTSDRSCLPRQWWPPPAAYTGQRAVGFTLLELLCVLALISILAAVLVPNLIGRDRTVELAGEARRLARVMDLAADRALRNNQEMGLKILEEGYSFVVFDARQEEWLSLQEKPFTEHQIASGFAIEAWIETPAYGSERQKRLPLLQGERPDLLILSSGEYTPFRVLFSGPDGGESGWQVVGDGFARIQARAGRGHKP